MNRRNPAAGLALAALSLLLALVGCGSGSEGSIATGETNAPMRQKSGPSAHGGEESIEGFGDEATGSRRNALLGTFHAYLSALAARRYGPACAHLSGTVHHSLSQLSSQGRGGHSCAATLAHLLRPTAAAVARAQASGRIAKVRVRGNLAFVVFHAPGANLYQLSLVRGGDGWKASVATPSILVPSRASLEG